MAERKTPSLGSKPDKIIREALMLAAKRECKDESGGKTTYLNRIAAMVVSKAVEGDAQAYKELFDRIEGRPQQQLDVTHEGEITHLSAAISAVDELTSFAFTGRSDQPNPDPLPN